MIVLLAESERASGGISADGLLAMYAHMGLDCLARDMKALGIPRDTAEQQLASVRHTVQHLTALEAKVKVRRPIQYSHCEAACVFSHQIARVHWRCHERGMQPL